MDGGGGMRSATLIQMATAADILSGRLDLAPYEFDLHVYGSMVVPQIQVTPGKGTKSVFRTVMGEPNRQESQHRHAIWTHVIKVEDCDVEVQVRYEWWYSAPPKCEKCGKLK